MCSDARYGDDDEYDDEGCEVVPWPTGWEFNWHAAIVENGDKDPGALPDVAWPAAEEILSEEIDDWWNWVATREADALTLGDRVESWLAAN